jgi:NCAIR mutase (PurE)-related protein
VIKISADPQNQNKNSGIADNFINNSNTDVNIVNGRNAGSSGPEILNAGDRNAKVIDTGINILQRRNNDSINTEIDKKIANNAVNAVNNNNSAKKKAVKNKKRISTAGKDPDDVLPFLMSGESDDSSIDYFDRL